MSIVEVYSRSPILTFAAQLPAARGMRSIRDPSTFISPRSLVTVPVSFPSASVPVNFEVVVWPSRPGRTAVKASFPSSNVRSWRSLSPMNVIHLPVRAPPSPLENDRINATGRPSTSLLIR